MIRSLKARVAQRIRRKVHQKPGRAEGTRQPSTGGDMLFHRVLDSRPGSFSWITPCQVKRGIYRMTLNKVFALGACLTRGMKLYCYQESSRERRPIIVIYLDGKPRNIEVGQLSDASGWAPAVELVRGTYRLIIRKRIAEGARLEKSQPLFCHRARDSQGRPILEVYLDGNPKHETINGGEKNRSGQSS